VPYAFSPADVAFLASPAGHEAMATADALPLTDRLRDVAALRSRLGERTAAVVEQVLLRRRAAGRFPAHWLLTADALEQATAAPVAAHRAARLAGRDVHDVTCSVGVELAALAPRARTVLGSDLDPVRLALAAHNAPGVALARADALAPPSRDAVLVADPGRRAGGGRRVFRPADFTPPLDALAAVAGWPGCQRSAVADTQRPKSSAHAAHGARDLVVSTAPGIEPDVVPWAAEVELVSLDGRVREAALWSAGLATARRRATVLSTRGEPQYALTDADDDTCGVREEQRHELPLVPPRVGVRERHPRPAPDG
jgi:hypothetical protein